MPLSSRLPALSQDSAADNGFLADGMPEPRSFGQAVPLPYNPVSLKNWATYHHEAPHPMPGKPQPKPKPPVVYSGLINKWEGHNAH